MRKLLLPKQELLILFCLSFCLTLSSSLAAFTNNNNLIDSLETVLAASQQQFPQGDESQLELYRLLIDQYRLAFHPELTTTATTAMRLAEKFSDDELKLHVLFAQGVYGTQQGRYQEAKGSLQKGLGLARIMDNPSVPPTEFMNSLGIVFSHLESYDEAIKRYQQVVDYTEKNCDGYPESFCTITAVKGYNNIGTTFSRIGQFEKALEYYEKALSLCEGLDRTFPEARDVARGMGATLGSIGNVYRNLERYDNAETFFKRSINYLRSANDQVNLPNALRYLADVLIKKEAYEEAEEMLKESIAIKEGLGLLTTELALNYITIANLDRIKERYDPALSSIQKAVDIVGEKEAYSVLIEAYDVKAKILTAQKNFVAANEALQSYKKYKEAYAKSDHAVKVKELEDKRLLSSDEEALIMESTGEGKKGGFTRYALIGALILLVLQIAWRLGRKK